MTRSEWLEIAARITVNWPNRPLDQTTLAKYFDDLQDLDANHVTAAVEVLHREGREWPPTAGIILGKLAELAVDAPDWADAARRIRRLVSRPTNVVRRGELVDERALALQREHPLIQAFVEHVGWREILACPTDDRIAEAQLRGKWEAFTRRQHRELALTGLPAAGLPTLERIGRQPGLRRAGEALAQILPSTGGTSHGS